MTLREKEEFVRQLLAVKAEEILAGCEALERFGRGEKLTLGEHRALNNLPDTPGRLSYGDLAALFREGHFYKYPKADHTVDGVILRGNEILLIRRGNPEDPFYNCWALPGGFLDVDSGETLADAFRREMKEELNFDNLLDICQVGTFSDPNRDPRGRVISTVFKVALDPEVKVKAGDDAAEYRWFPVDKLPPLAFDHATILVTVL